MAGNNKLKKSLYISNLKQGHLLLKEQILYSKHLLTKDTNIVNGLIDLDEEYFGYLLNGIKPRLDHGANFPGRLIKTKDTLDDLIVKDQIKNQFNPVMNYMMAKLTDYYKKHSKFKEGFTMLLYGPPGSGKTYASSILGNMLKLDIYKIDLSSVVSKYIGETEKHLKAVFDRLQGKNCILYFDEADALFGKRSEVKDAKDRYANQEISYLLQRIEEFDGLTILSTNFENNIDEAFMRRINVKINMTRPEQRERVLLWSHYLPEGYFFEKKELQLYLACEYSFTGANIKNILEMVTLELHIQREENITFDNILPYLKIECEKTFGVNYTIESYHNFLNR